MLITLTVFVTFRQAQDFKFGKVSKEELYEKVHPLDSSVNAAVLYRSEDISFKYMPGDGFTQQRLIHERVKIYNSSGKDYGTKRLSLYSGSSGRVEKLIGLKGVTYNLDKGKVVKEKLRKDGMFKEEANDFYNYESFTMPNVQEGSIKGKSRVALTNHKALDFRESYIKRNKEDFLEASENKYNGIVVDNFEVKNETQLIKPIVFSYDVLAEEQVDIISDKIYLNPMLFLRTIENPFKLEKRDYPIDFGYPQSEKYNISIELPEGYKIESMPAVSVFKLLGGVGSFDYNITESNGKLQLVINYSINASIIEPDYYTDLKEFFNQIVIKEYEKIILSKQ